MVGDTDRILIRTSNPDVSEKKREGVTIQVKALHDHILLSCYY